MPDGEENIERIIGRISANVESLVKLQEKRDNDVEGLERRMNTADAERSTLKVAMEGVMQRVVTLHTENQQQGIAINQKLDTMQESVRHLESQERLSPEARAWVHDQHQAHVLRRETDLQVTRGRLTAINWPALVGIGISLLTLIVLAYSLVHH